MLSLKQTIEDTFGPTDLNGGIRQSLFNDFYETRPELYPFKNDEGNISLKKTLEHWKSWPQRTDFISEASYPHNTRTPYSQKIQGLSHTENYWVFSQRECIITCWPVNRDLDASSGFAYREEVPNSQLPEAYSHYGDCSARYFPDAGKWLIVVGVEGDMLPNAFCFHAFDDPGFSSSTLGSLDFLGYWQINVAPQNVLGRTNTPWAAISPSVDLIYSSIFGEAGNTMSQLQVYGFSNAVQNNALQVPQVNHIDDFNLLKKDGSKFEITRVQGGTVSPNGRLYLSVDKKANEGGGFYGFDLPTGRCLLYISSSGDQGLAAEIEGITTWLNKPAQTPNVTGHVHMTVLDFEPIIDDDIEIRHWRCTRGDDV